MLQSYSAAKSADPVTPTGHDGAFSRAGRVTPLRRASGLPAGALSFRKRPADAWRFVSRDGGRPFHVVFRIKSLNAENPVSLMALRMIELREDAYQISTGTLARFGYTSADLSLHSAAALRLARQFRPVLFTSNPFTVEE